MNAVVILSKAAKKDLKYIPKHILVLLDLWIEIIESEGLTAMQKINGYTDHALVGDRLGQRSSSLTRSWRVIYFVETESKLVKVEVLEVNHHDY